MRRSALHCGLSRDDFYRLTIRELFTVFAVTKDRQREAYELACMQAYQTVRVWAITRSKKRMPKFSEVVGGDSNPNTLDRDTHPAQARAWLEMLAARTGRKVRVSSHGQ